MATEIRSVAIFFMPYRITTTRLFLLLAPLLLRAGRAGGGLADLTLTRLFRRFRVNIRPIILRIKILEINTAAHMGNADPVCCADAKAA